ncbi:hypothetical protein BJY01DRAFT_215186 [Aspergillus pseudoustus]|uniref:Secreted protein n=1 Tax=Aspergillus pseudoustus TaxID=1810923 RepID=A0ABR4JVR8_9EURO
MLGVWVASCIICRWCLSERVAWGQARDVQGTKLLSRRGKKRRDQGRKASAGRMAEGSREERNGKHSILDCVCVYYIQIGIYILGGRMGSGIPDSQHQTQPSGVATRNQKIEKRMH